MSKAVSAKALGTAVTACLSTTRSAAAATAGVAAKRQDVVHHQRQQPNGQTTGCRTPPAPRARRASSKADDALIRAFCAYSSVLRFHPASVCNSSYAGQ